MITMDAPPDPQPPRPMPIPLRTERLGRELVSPEHLTRLADVGRSPVSSPLRSATRRPEASARIASATRAADEPPVRPAASPRAPVAPEAPAAGPFSSSSPETVDASVILPLYRPGPPAESLPSPARPLNGPLVLGALSLISAVLVPLSVLFESDQVFGILGFCLSGFFLPFAPIAWIAGLAAERRRREQGLRSETRVIAGRLLGQWGTVLLVVEASAILFLVAVLRLAGKIPASFNVH